MADQVEQTKPVSGPRVGLTIAFAVMMGVFVALATGPILHMVALPLPTTDTGVEVIGRERTRSMGLGRSFVERWSHWVIVRLEDGRELRIDSPEALYNKALPGLMRLQEVTLRRSVLLDIPVTMNLTSRMSPSQSETYSLLMPIWLALFLAGAMLGLASIVLGIAMKRPDKPLHWPTLAVCMALSAGIGVWLWVPA